MRPLYLFFILIFIMSLFYFGIFDIILPSRCSLGISNIRCDRLRITENGVEILLKNNRDTQNFDKAYLSYFSVYLDSCKKKMEAKNGLFKNEVEKMVFTNCTNGEIGDTLKSNINIQYSEGVQSRAINRTSTGIIKGEVTY